MSDPTSPHQESSPDPKISSPKTSSLREPLRVTAAEAGQKLLAFLARRVAAPQSMLHKWVRSGQVRINGLRVKAFVRVVLDDVVRVPPFAALRLIDSIQDPSTPISPSTKLALPPCLYEDEHIMLLHKPAGLPVQPGTGHTDSISTRLTAHYGHHAFVPTPAHRLDKMTSGLLVVGKTYTGLRAMQDLFARRDALSLSTADSSKQATMPFEKTYLAWLCGSCPWDSSTSLTHHLAKRANGIYERVVEHQNGQVAHSIVQCLRKVNSAQKTYSLVQVHILTGRTHQIRAQMAIMGFPVLGDTKYGGEPFTSMLLHAYRLVLPQGIFEVYPSWPIPFVVDYVSR